MLKRASYMRMLTGWWTSLEPAKENGSIRPYSDMTTYVILYTGYKSREAVVVERNNCAVRSKMLQWGNRGKND
jgi:hypothetical protein